MTMALEFRDHHTLGHPWQQQVLNAGVVIGHIRRNGGGLYRYYHGPVHQLTAEFADLSLEELKLKIEARHGN